MPSRANHPMPLPVVFVTYPNITLLDLAGPMQVFAGAEHHDTGAIAYETAVVSTDGRPVSTNTSLIIDTEPMAAWLNRSIHTLVIVGGNGASAAMHDKELVDGVALLAQRSQRVCSVCTGALVLAAAGLLDGRRVVTHWQHCAPLANAFPRVRVETDPIYIRDGHVWTSAGVTAGIDMALGVVEDDLGREAALKLAQSLVTYMVRPGGQSQFSPALERQKLDRSDTFDGLHRWIAGNLRGDLRIERLAEQVNMSTRTFQRLYSKTTGTTPAKAVETLRMEGAREMLETTAIAIKVVAERCGFGDIERMRRAFVRSLGVSPSEYRQRFRTSNGTNRVSTG